jgi:hypothetical protein
VAKVSRQHLAERLAAAAHETWMRQARRQGAVNPPTEVSDRDFERAEDTIKELELLGIVDFGPRRRREFGRFKQPAAFAAVVAGFGVAAAGHHFGHGLMTAVGVVAALVGVIASGSTS